VITWNLRRIFFIFRIWQKSESQKNSGVVWWEKSYIR
jgi:hypothetical protein